MLGLRMDSIMAAFLLACSAELFAQSLGGAASPGTAESAKTEADKTAEANARAAEIARRCGENQSGYEVKGAEVFYIFRDPLDFSCASNKSKWVEKADPQTIRQIRQPITKRCGPVCWQYAKDKDRVYFLGEVIEGANPESFQFLEAPVAKDSKSVFWLGRRIPNADPGSFALISGEIFKDKSGVYWSGKYLPNSDPKTFAGIDGSDGLFKDKNAVYGNGEELPGRDPETFRVVQSYKGWTMDRNGVYYENRKLPEVDLASFRIFAGNVATDKNYRYFGATQICSFRPEDAAKPNAC